MDQSPFLSVRRDMLVSFEERVTVTFSIPSPMSEELSSLKSQKTLPPSSTILAAVRFNRGLSPAAISKAVSLLDSTIQRTLPSVVILSSKFQFPGATDTLTSPDELVDSRCTVPRPSSETNNSETPSSTSSE